MAKDYESFAVPDIDIAQERVKPRLVALLFFDFLSFTKEDKPNLLGVFERVFVPRDEKKVPPIGFFLRTAYTVRGRIQITIYAPSGLATGGFGFELDEQKIAETKATHTQLIGTVGFETPEEGTYWIAVLYNDELLGGVRLSVEFRPPEEKKHEHASGAVTPA